jgi:hypothetical protein
MMLAMTLAIEAAQHSTLKQKLALVGVLSMAFASGRLSAHNIVASRFEYHRDVLPIIERRCGACHRPEGAAPMSLLTYSEARPHAVAIKELVLRREMPPWYAEEGALGFEGEMSLSAREIDVLSEWASGGAPEGRQPDSPVGFVESLEPPRPPLDRPPDLSLALGETVLRAGVDGLDSEHSFVLSSTAPRYLRAWRLVPSRRDILRSGVFELVAGGSRTVLDTWVPGDTPRIYPENSAWEIPSNASLSVRLVYSKPWRLRREEVRSRGSLELWFAPEKPSRLLRSLPLGNSNFGALKDAALLGVHPPPSAVPLRIEGRLPSGQDGVLLEVFHTRAGWPRSYWLAVPLPLQGPLRVSTPASPNGPPSGGAVFVAMAVE